MNIHVYAVAYNEELLMPFFLRHYCKFANQITIFDNESTDRTAEIIRSFGANVISFKTNNTMMDSVQVRIKNEEYKKSRGKADWVIVVDSDELVYHPDIVSLLAKYKKDGITFPKVDGYDMIGDDYPKFEGQLYDEIKQGVSEWMYCKRAIFDPFIGINYVVGAHKCSPHGSIVESKKAEIKLLHYRFLCKDFFVKNMEKRMRRMSEENIKNRWSVLVLPPEETIGHWASGFYESKRKNRIKVI